MNIIDWLLGSKFRYKMTLSEFERLTRLKFNHDNFLYEYGDIKLTMELVRDAEKRGDLEGLAIALIKHYPNIYNLKEYTR